MTPMAVRTCSNQSISRTAWRSTAARAAAAALLCLCTVGGSLHAATLAEGKAAAAAGDHPRAGQIFSTVRDSGAADHRAEAALLALYELRETGNHAAVAAQYNASLAAARGTRFESRCMFEYAKSLHYNAKDTTEALRLYERITEEYPLEAFAASGSLLETGRIQLKDWAAPNTACDTFELAVSQYPDSPFADDALVAQAEAAVQIARIDLIDSADRRLREMNAVPAMLQKVQFCRGEYHSKVRGDRFQAIEEYMKTANGFPGKSHAAALAKIRAADLVVQGDFELSRRMYEEVLAEYPALPRSQREWAKCQAAIYTYQRWDESRARALFAEVVRDAVSPNVRKTAELYLAGLDNPESIAGMRIVYDRGLRWWQTKSATDEAFMDMQRFLAKTRQSFFESYMADRATTAEERAQLLYRMSFANYMCGRGKEALELASRALAEGAPVGGTGWTECQYMVAHLLARGNRWGEAAEAWQRFIDVNPRAASMPRAYMEYSRALHLSGDALGAVMALEELIVRFPAHKNAQMASGLLEEHFLRQPDLRPALEARKPEIAAKWKGKEPPLRPDMLHDEEMMLTLNSPVNTTGGAE